METRPGPFSGKLTQADVELAAALEDAKAHYEGWSHVSQVLVDGCTVELYRQALESGLYEYYATGELPLSPEELLEVNWDLEYRLVVRAALALSLIASSSDCGGTSMQRTFARLGARRTRGWSRSSCTGRSSFRGH